MNATLLSMIGGSALSLILAYVPGVKPWFGKLNGTQKRGIMALLLLMLAGASFGLACWRPDTIVKGLACNETGLLELVGIYILALTANQSTYSIAVRSRTTVDVGMAFPADESESAGG